MLSSIKRFARCLGVFTIVSCIITSPGNAFAQAISLNSPVRTELQPFAPAQNRAESDLPNDDLPGETFEIYQTWTQQDCISDFVDTHLTHPELVEYCLNPGDSVMVVSGRGPAPGNPEETGGGSMPTSCIGFNDFFGNLYCKLPAGAENSSTLLHFGIPLVPNTPIMHRFACKGTGSQIISNLTYDLFDGDDDCFNGATVDEMRAAGFQYLGYTRIGALGISYSTVNLRFEEVLRSFGCHTSSHHTQCGNTYNLLLQMAWSWNPIWYYSNQQMNHKYGYGNSDCGYRSIVKSIVGKGPPVMSPCW